MKIIFDSEAELEAFIHDKWNEEGVCCIDDSSPEFLERQLNLNEYGICDLVAFTFYQYEDVRSVDVVVYELKKEKITSDAFSQVSRYATGIEQAFKQKDSSLSVSITCVLVGTEIDDSCYILNQSEFMYYKPFFNPESGVDFKELGSGWHRKNDVPVRISDFVDNCFVKNEAVSEVPKDEH